jgi:hypothetical protein
VAEDPRVLDVLNPLAAVADCYSGGADDETLVYVHLGRLRNVRELMKALSGEEAQHTTMLVHDAFGTRVRGETE